ncbi:hypothetical protein L1887_36838 [Cichorium endivia]|nr:hypothetical protein L1887_36838 [Cichorium endivia]
MLLLLNFPTPVHGFSELVIVAVIGGCDILTKAEVSEGSEPSAAACLRVGKGLGQAEIRSYRTHILVTVKSRSRDGSRGKY